MKAKSIYISLLLIIALLFLISISLAQTSHSYDYDIIVKNGKIYDGSLKSAFRADIAIKGDQIVKVARSITGTAKRVIQARGLIVTPGFIDMHTHVDRGMFYPENRACLNYLKQGVTMVVVGQCGGSAWPIFEEAKDQMKRWTEESIGPNAALLVGHGSVRRLVMGMEDREPTDEELEQMKALVKEAMEQGAYGISTGLIYLPGKYAKTGEIIELVKVIVSYGGIYHSHIRGESDQLLESVKEAIEIGEKTGAPVHISHFKAIGCANWGKVKDACKLIEDAQARGLKVTADQYPYRFSSNYPYIPLVPRKTWVGNASDELLKTQDVRTVFDYLRDDQLIDLYNKVSPNSMISERHQQYLEELPRKELVNLVTNTIANPRNLQGPMSEKERYMFLERLKDPEEANKILDEVRKYLNDPVPPEYVIIASCVEKELEGKSLKQVAKIKSKSVEGAAIELALMGALAVPMKMCEEDIEYAMKKDWVATGSDGVASFYGIGMPHIRSYSTFLHKIKKYALQRKTVSLAHVIRSQTSLAAKIMNWDDRGWIKSGYKADIVVIDLKKLKTETSISYPHAYSEGVEYLLINGKVVINDGKYSGELPGRVLKLKK
ncbi:MAG: D-aminoacylase [bacterium]|nr:MAG: D-aminoacylase [bacterium]